MGFIKKIITVVFLFNVLLTALANNSATATFKTDGAFGTSNSGAATFRIPILLPTGPQNLTPSLALEYNSQRGNGLMGVGWALGGLSSITRCPKTLPVDGIKRPVVYDANDAYCLDGARLIKHPSANEYRTEIDSFSQVLFSGGSNGHSSFVVKNKNGQVFKYGTTSDSQIISRYSANNSYSSGSRDAIAIWALSEISDVNGNLIKITYFNANDLNGDFYPATITYGTNRNSDASFAYQIQFAYETRNDNYNMYYGGAKSVLRNRLKQISLVDPKNSNAVIKSYLLTYSENGSPAYSVLKSIKECAAANNCLPPIALSYNNDVGGQIQFATYNSQLIHRGILTEYNPARAQFKNRPNSEKDFVTWTDFNGDGTLDYCRRVGDVNAKTTAVVQCLLAIPGANGNGVSFTDTAVSSVYSYDAAESKAYWPDLDGDGKSDFCTIKQIHAHAECELSTGSSFSYRSNFHANLPYRPKEYDVPFQTQIDYYWPDLNGDGKSDICYQKSTPITKKQTHDGDRELVAYDHEIGCRLNIGNWSTSNFGGPITRRIELATIVDAGRNTTFQNNSLSSVNFKDMDGNGSVDLCLKLENSTTKGGSFDTQCYLSNNTSFASSPVSFSQLNGSYSYNQSMREDAWVDINGDGMPDNCRSIVVSDSEFGTLNHSHQCRLFSGTNLQISLSNTNNNRAGEYNTYWVDVNADGMADQCLGNDLPGTRGNLYNAVNCNLFNGKSGFTIPTSSFTPAFNPKFPQSQAWVDVNGDGAADFCGVSINGPNIVCYIASNVKFPLLTKIENQIPNSSLVWGFNYRALTHALVEGFYQLKEPKTQFPYPTIEPINTTKLLVSASVTNDAGTSSQFTYKYGGYQYEQPERSGVGRGSLGFKTVIKNDVTAGLVHTTNFSQTWPFTGRPLVETTTTTAGQVVRKVSYKYEKGIASTSNTLFPYLEGQWVQNFDLNGTALPVKSVFYTYSTDQNFGDPTYIETIEAGNCVKERSRFSYINPNPAEWIVSKVVDTATEREKVDNVADCAPGSALNPRGIGSAFAEVYPPPPPSPPRPINKSVSSWIHLLLD